MTLNEIVSRAADGYGLMRSRERHEVELTFESGAKAVAFMGWCEGKRIAHKRKGSLVVTIYVG